MFLNIYSCCCCPFFRRLQYIFHCLHLEKKSSSWWLFWKSSMFDICSWRLFFEELQIFKKASGLKYNVRYISMICLKKREKIKRNFKNKLHCLLMSFCSLLTMDHSQDYRGCHGSVNQKRRLNIFNILVDFVAFLHIVMLDMVHHISWKQSK